MPGIGLWLTQIFWPAGAPTRIDTGGAGDGGPRVERDDLRGSVARSLEFGGGLRLRRVSTGAGRPTTTSGLVVPLHLVTYLRGRLLRGQAGRD